MDYTDSCSCRHPDFGFVGVSALEGEYKEVQEENDKLKASI